MPKQVFENGKLTVKHDPTDPKDILKLSKKTNKGKNLKGLTQKEKADLFDLYVAAGVIEN